MWSLLVACTSPAPAPAPVVELDLPLALELALPCAPGCELEERARQAVERGVSEIERAARAGDDLEIDVLIALAGVRKTFASDRLTALEASLRTRLDSGTDPRRRFWAPEQRMPTDWEPAWKPDSAHKVSPNHLLVEALFCSEHGFRPEVVGYACEVYRDDGGLYSAHAAWGLAMAVDQKCVERSSTCLDALRDELVAAATADPPLATTLERDRLAEQVLFGLMAGADAAALGGPVERLLDAQTPSGSMAVPAEGENPWWGTHATLAATWAWAAWLRDR